MAYDVFKKKVYYVDTVLRKAWESRILTQSDFKTIMDMVSSFYGFKPYIKLQFNRKCKIAATLTRVNHNLSTHIKTYNHDEPIIIRMHPNAFRLGVFLHELAHVIMTYTHSPLVPAHGREFIDTHKTLIGLIQGQRDMAVYEILCAVYKLPITQDMEKFPFTTEFSEPEPE